MSLHRKIEALLTLDPDVAVIGECAIPDILQRRGSTEWIEDEHVWIGQNPNKGLAVFGFNGHAARLHEPYHQTLKYIAPVHIHGPAEFNLLAAWDIDYVFAPRHRLGAISNFYVGSFEDWCGNGLSDHVPIVVDIDM